MATKFKARVISFGRITIPYYIRDELNIKYGDHVQISDLKKLVIVEDKNEEAA